MRVYDEHANKFSETIRIVLKPATVRYALHNYTRLSTDGRFTRSVFTGCQFQIRRNRRRIRVTRTNLTFRRVAAVPNPSDGRSIRFRRVSGSTASIGWPTIMPRWRRRTRVVRSLLTYVSVRCRFRQLARAVKGRNHSRELSFPTI